MYDSRGALAPADALEELSKFTFTSKYAKYLPEKKRRETWHETVNRVESMHLKKFSFLNERDLQQIREAFDMVREKKAIPSMRSLEINTPIPTPQGWSRAGDLGIGDYVFDEDGNPSEITDIFEFKDIDLYDVIFSDGTVIRASEDHLWVTSTLDDRMKTPIRKRVISTGEIKKTLFQGIKNKRRNHVVWNSAPLQLPDSELPLNPYVLGAWLGDGYASGGQFACDFSDSVEMSGFYTGAGFEAHKVSNNPYLWGTYGLHKLLREENLLFNKHIPEKYLRSSVEQRLELLRGLMDSDGCITDDGRCSFANTNERIIEGFEELLSSLGIKYSKSKIIGEKEGNRKNIYNIFFFTDYTVFRLSRKANKSKRPVSNQTRYRSIVDVRYAGKGDAICYSVNSPSHTYLASKNMVVTHNCMQYAGAPIEKNNLRLYNCAMLYCDRLESFSEYFYLGLSGCGVGVSLQKNFFNKLPDLINERTDSYYYTIPDSIEGWADSILILMKSFTIGNELSGKQIKFDYSQIREEGAPLSIGGKAPGAAGLISCHKKIERLLNNLISNNLISNSRTRLRTIDAYDIFMFCAEAILSGSQRRSASIMLFDKDDELMINAKTGNWFLENPQRAKSNNSIIIDRNNITKEEFLYFFERTKTFGEPNFIFADDLSTVFNPCGEVSTIPITASGKTGVQMCNLCSIVGDHITDEEEFRKATWAASLIGTLQAAYTDFPYLGVESKEVTEEEALLGVSITGFLSNPGLLLNETLLKESAEYAVKINEEWAEKLGINPAARVTCSKPSGNSSAALGSAFSGIHPAHSKKYFRRVQCNKLENPYIHFKKLNPEFCEESIYSAGRTDDVIMFPIEITSDSIFKEDLSAIEHLEIIRRVQQTWVMSGQKNNKKPISHSISCTVVVHDDEWENVADYIYKNKEYFSTVSFLPFDGDKIYQQAPFEKLETEEDFERFEYLTRILKPVDYTQMIEESDETDFAGEVACAGGACLV